LNTTKVFSVVVTYNPDLTLLNYQLLALSTQVDGIVIVDNGSNDLIKERLSFLKNAYVISLHDNYGLPYAQNVGIKFADAFNVDYVLLMDQDSVPNTDMVKTLLLGFTSETIAAVGSSYIDDRNQVNSFFVIEKNGRPAKLKPNLIPSISPFIEVAALISSGTLIEMNALKCIGPLRSDYFIDRVDTEWSLRARATGYKLLGATQPLMTHTIGDEVENVWFFGRRNVPYHTPLRDYYLFRNTFHILRDVKLNLAWRLHFLKILVLFVGYFLIFSKYRFNRLYYMSLGIYDGLKNVRGQFKH
jgi:rhamnosyltransferase